jgi:Flp pilus assembly protein TadD
MIARTPTELAVAVLAAGSLLAGCASSVRPGLASRFVRPATPDSDTSPAPYETSPPVEHSAVIADHLRELAAQAKPTPRRSTGASLESVDEKLGAALLALKARPGGDAHRRVADEYARLDVLDAAQAHYHAAIEMDPKDAAAYDGLARVWRNAGLPARALGEAHRAVFFGPRSPESQNTLGTVLQALGQPALAMRAYERALALAPGAAYALNNLGYLALVEGNAPAAIGYCRSAIAADPALAAARHNLALAYAAAGRMDLARETLRDAGSAARAAYNEGIINLSLGRLSDARAAFEAACSARGAPADSCSRARALKASRSEVVGGSE